MGGRGARKGRRDGSEAPSIHPRNHYAAAAPDFAALANLYPSFRSLISVSERSRASVDFAATRELTRVLLLHDHGAPSTGGCHWLFLQPFNGILTNYYAEFAANCNFSLQFAHGIPETNKHCGA